jgi:hypothetical protein
MIGGNWLLRPGRQAPPWGEAPIYASSISEAHRRSPLMRWLSRSVWVSRFMMFSGRAGLQGLPGVFGLFDLSLQS